MAQLATLLQMFAFYVFGFMNPDIWNRTLHVECYANTAKVVLKATQTFENTNVTRHFLDYFKGIFWMSVVKLLLLTPSFCLKARGAIKALSKGEWNY